MDSKNKAIEDLMEHKFFKDNLDNFEIFIKYIIARMDIKNYGNKENDLVILECSDPKCEIEAPNWFKTQEGTGWKIESKKGELDLKIKCINEGQLKIYIRGVGYKNKNHNQNVVIDVNFTKFLVNGTTIFDAESCNNYPDKYFFYTLDKVKNDEIVDIHIEWEPF